MSADGQRRATNAQVERRAGNQAVYRMVNNRILDVNDAFSEWDHAEFLCECVPGLPTKIATETAEQT
jgi:hypothetical protein